MTFRDLGLIPPILSALHTQGYRQPSPIQEKAIPPALEGRDVLGCAQTGTGKTCAFAAPILQRLSQTDEKNHVVRALILTPTRELAIQIGENFEAYGKNLPLRTAVIFGGVGQGPQVEKLKKGVDILVATPGRLGDLYQQKLLDLSQIQIFVLDEADRMLDMGFIHDVKKILKWLPHKKQTMLFSATMPPEITELVNSLLHRPARVAVNPVSSAVEIIEQTVYFVDKGNKTPLLAHLVEKLHVKNALVFTRTKHGANKVARDLEKLGIAAAAIHGNKSQTARQQALADFKSGKVRCLVATDIAARGLDIEELSHVFNYNLSEVPETYVHRIGRTGRAGRGGQAIAFCDFAEKALLKEIEKLMGREVPVVEDHPFPMQNFDSPKRDKHGRIINEEDAEARAAARELRRTRDEAQKAVAKEKRQEEQKKKQKTVSVAEEEKSVVPHKSKGKKARKQSRSAQDVSVKETAAVCEEPQAAPVEKRSRTKLTRPGTRMETGDSVPVTEFYRPDPLAGDSIMDATARLLAPRRGSVPVQQRSAPVKPIRKAEQKKRSRKPSDVSRVMQESAVREEKAPVSGKKHRPEKVSVTEKKQNAPKSSVPEKKQGKEKKTEGRPENRAKSKMKQSGQEKKGVRTAGEFGESMRSGYTKDSTEQKSLMKPYYLTF